MQAMEVAFLIKYPFIKTNDHLRTKTLNKYIATLVMLGHDFSTNIHAHNGLNFNSFVTRIVGNSD